jgi:predicted MPP superfamily phosphohydrolase
MSGLVLWSTWWEPSSLRVAEYRIEVPSWPVSDSDLRIALLSDLHVGSPFNGLNNLRRVVEKTNATRPDVVLLAGDFVILNVLGGHFVPPEPAAEVLRDLKAPLGVYAVLGNHDWWFDHGRVARALSRVGIRVIDQQALRVSTDRYSFWLVGVGDLWEGDHSVKAAIEQVTDDGPVLLVTHNPDIFPDVPARVSLTMAGHTHGGQVYLPLAGRLVVPSLYGQRFAIGHIVEGGRHLFVTPGIGTSIVPVRFMVPPEISVLQLVGAG